jgi:hypothetical protein
MAAVMTRQDRSAAAGCRRRWAGRAVAGAAAVVWLAAFLGLSAVPSGAHITGPQLISSIDGFASATGTPIALPGISYSLLSTGSAPYATVSVSGNHTFEVFGHAGEPFFRITDQGVEINRNSPSVTFFVNDPGKPIADFPARVNPAANWEMASTQPVFHYYERRAEWPHTGPPAEAEALGKTAIVYRFAIDANDSGTPVEIIGHVTWVPAPFNLEIPLLFVPIIIVALLWIEPKAKRYLRPLAVVTAAATVLGAALDAGRTVVTLTTNPSAGSVAPLAVVPGLILVVAAGVPQLLAGRRRAYGWVAVFGLYLAIFGVLHASLFTPSVAAAVVWLHRAELVVGVVIAAGGGLLVFLTSPVRRPGGRARSSGGSRRIAYGNPA